MKAIQYRRSIPRYLLVRALGRRWRGISTSGLSSLALRELPEPALPGDQWVRVRPRMAGICGSDLATIDAKSSPYLAPLTSMPFVLGHEVVGVVGEVGRDVDRVKVGDRVVLQPALGCAVRGIDPQCAACEAGSAALCRNVTRGDISAGIQTGYCRDTGGGFSGGFVAHQSQLYLVPAEVPDRAAVLIEPFSCALHGALRVQVGKRDAALVLGCGAIGLLTIAALRATGCAAKIFAVARHPHQREWARRLGADELLPAGGSLRDRYDAWAKACVAEVHDPELGKPTVIGGFDVVFDCVGSPASIDDAIRFTRAGGVMVLIGMPGAKKGVDWTPLWYKEATVRASYAYGAEPSDPQNRATFDIAIELMAECADRLAPMVGGEYSLHAYRQAFASAMATGTSCVVKTVFVMEDGRT